MDNGQHTDQEVSMADLEHYKQLVEQLEAESMQMKERLWVDSNLTKFDDVLRSNYDQSLSTFADAVIFHLAKLTQALRGTFFSLNSELNLVQAVAGYACTVETLPKSEFHIGEGLVGQAIKGKEIIVLDNIPQHNMVLEASMGQLSGNCVVVIPLMFNQESYGAVELLYLQNIEQKYLDLLERLSQNIASMLNSIQNNIKTRKLLEDSKELEKELRTQEEELRQNMEELHATQEKMHRKEKELSSNINAINQTMGTVEFDLKGRIMHANPLFLELMDYQMDHLVGKHHRMFLEEENANSPEYQDFWKNLTLGSTQSGEYLRIGNGGKKIWLRASYTPVKGMDGTPFKIMMLAVDITQERELRQDLDNQMLAISKSNAVVEMDVHGIVQKANSLFLELTGYTTEEIKGKHHRQFVKPKYAESDEYKEFWEQLKQGKFIEGEFERVNKEGKRLWIKGSYNPIVDESGKVYKVMKYALDITSQKVLEFENAEQLEELKAVEEEIRQNMEELVATQEKMTKKELELSSNLLAIDYTISSIEFSPEGIILRANQLFLDLMGYTAEEITGKHHRLFVTPEYAQSSEYISFWKDLQQGKSVSSEFKRVANNGKEIWLRATYTPVKDSYGEVLKILKLAMDVTDEKLLHQDFSNQLMAIERSNAVVEFDLEGNILEANNNFLDIIGYTQDEVVGKHHQLFVDANYAKSIEYQQFWNQLRNGQFVEGEFTRLTKDQREIWIKGSYNPIMGLDNKPYKIVKYALDITNRKQLEAENAQNLEEVKTVEEELRQNMEELIATQDKIQQKEEELTSNLSAINHTICKIEFNPEGKILKANQLFLDLMGYTSEEVAGQHHRMFVDTAYAQSQEYAQFWQKLRNGESIDSEFKRFGNNGKEVWLRATYTPVKDASGVIAKVIKLALDVTEEKRLRTDIGNQLNAINRANAVIEFDLQGNILEVNDNFLAVVGYTSEEVIGKHHQIFVKAADAQSIEYQQFWHQLRNGNPIEGDFERVAKDGNTVWINGNYNPIIGLDGKPYKIVKFASDITERKKLEMSNAQNLEELKAVEEELRQNMEELTSTQEELQKQVAVVDKSKRQIDAVLTTAIDVIITMDARGIVATINPAVSDIFGYQPEEIIGQNVKVLMPDNYASAHDGYLANYLNTGEKKIIGIGRKVEAQHKDGTVFDAHISVSEFKLDDQQMFTGFIRKLD
ncbi:hypothetical protein BKI52_00680 [marine bacterium AO1-C]|nr:hypothetical protein BKI52_00680 [marine bacterium AO1-C]